MVPHATSPTARRCLPGQLGWGLTAEAGKYGGEHWLADFRYQGASPNLDINDAGYFQMSNYHDFFGSVTWRELKPHGPIRDMSYQLYGGTNRTWDFAGKNRTRVGFSSSFDFQNFWNVNFALVPYVARYDLYRETHSDALAEYPHSFSYAIDVKTDTRRKVILELDTSIRGALRGVESEHRCHAQPAADPHARARSDLELLYGDRCAALARDDVQSERVTHVLLR